MKINLIVVGKKLPEWLNTGIQHYQKQLPSNYNFSITVLEPQNRKSSSIEKIKSLEGDMLIKVASSSTTLIGFDEKGKQQTSKAIAESLKDWQLEGDNVALLIGGAEGLSTQCKQKCHQLWGLSGLTLTHNMARLLVVEQLFRGHSLLNKHPYHRE